MGSGLGQQWQRLRGHVGRALPCRQHGNMQAGHVHDGDMEKHPLREGVPAAATSTDAGSILFSQASRDQLVATASSTAAHREVRVRITVKRVMEVNLVEHSFKAHVQLEASWIDPDLAEVDLKKHQPDLTDVDRCQRAGILKLEGLEKKSFFTPRITFKNCLKVDEDSSQQWYKIYPDAEPVVCFRWELTGQFRTTFDLARFPIDSQKLPLVVISGWPSIESMHNTAKYAVTLKNNRSGKYRSFCVVDPTGDISSEYVLSKRVRFTSCLTDPQQSAQELTYSMLTMDLHVERKEGFWVHHLIIPLFIITTTLMLGYAIGQENFNDRAQFTLTLLLSQVGFKYVVASMLPRLSYVTYIDLYVLGCFATTFIVTLEQSIASTGLFIEPLLTLNMTFNTTMAATNGHLLSNGQPPRGPARISLIAVYGLVAWLALHLILHCMVLNARRKDRDANKFFYHGLELDRVVWVGPIEIRRDAGDTCTEIASHFAKLVPGTNPQVTVWTPAKINAAFEARGEVGHTSNHPCAVVVFDDDYSAESAYISHTKRLESGLDPLAWAACDPETGSRAVVKAEPLTEAFGYALDWLR
eukprot:COSAG02_NODE_1152_length_14201_cov_9.055595_1_plen_584_part_00